MNFLLELPRPFFVLAPMDDVTDTVFRRIVAGCAAPDVYFTEFVNVDGLQSPGREHLLKKLQYAAGEQPLIAQVWGKSPENYYKTAQELVRMGFAGIDINMGCPAKPVVQNGCCSALIENRPLALEIIKATQAGAAAAIPVSVKTRLGFREVDLTWPEFLLQQKLNMLTIHGRTQRQMSAVPADWDLIGKVKALRDKFAPETLIVGNGDVNSRMQGEMLAQKYGLDGIMIGRGVFHDPCAFSLKSPWADYSKAQRIDLFRRHIMLFVETWAGQRPIAPLNRFCKIYINNFDGAKEAREQLMEAQSIEQLLQLLDRV